MGVESRTGHLSNMICTVQNSEPIKASATKLSRNSPATSDLEQFFESFVAEALDHRKSL
jgi:hypothetical protein